MMRMKDYDKLLSKLTFALECLGHDDYADAEMLLKQAIEFLKTQQTKKHYDL
jgi:hypothetical protein